MKTHPPSAPQAFDLVVVTIGHSYIRLSSLKQDDIIKAYLDDTPIRLQVFSYSAVKPDPMATGFITLTIADPRKWYSLLLKSKKLVVDIPGVESVTIPIERGVAELQKVEACDLRPRRGE